jgi:hypothetical protein
MDVASAETVKAVLASNYARLLEIALGAAL